MVHRPQKQEFFTCNAAQRTKTDAEGAFGAVERRRFTAADGTSSFYAVKHLKQQDVQLQVRQRASRGTAPVPLCF